jgi:hypothetical protein
MATLGLISANAVATNINQFNYAGISFQKHSYDNINFSPAIDTTKLTPYTYDESSSESGYRGFVGHQFNRYIAVEAGITSFGSAEFLVKETVPAANNKTKTTVIHSGEFSTLAADIRVNGTYSLTDSLFLKASVGAQAWDNDKSFLVENTEGLAVDKVSDTGVSLLAGVGIGYGFNSSMAMSFDYEQTEIADITTKTLGLAFFLRF